MKPLTAFLLGMLLMACVDRPAVRHAAVSGGRFALESGKRIVERSKAPQPVIVVSPEP